MLWKEEQSEIKEIRRGCHLFGLVRVALIEKITFEIQRGNWRCKYQIRAF